MQWRSLLRTEIPSSVSDAIDMLPGVPTDRELIHDFPIVMAPVEPAYLGVYRIRQADVVETIDANRMGGCHLANQLPTVLMEQKSWTLMGSESDQRRKRILLQRLVTSIIIIPAPVRVQWRIDQVIPNRRRSYASYRWLLG
jgi:hypothetical protein